MSDAPQRLEKLRDAAADCAMTASEMTDKKQRDLFVTMARHLAILADHFEKPSDTFLGRKTYEPFPLEKELDARRLGGILQNPCGV
jgi:hypothetical protein